MISLPQTIVEAADWLRSGRITSVELTETLLGRCRATQDSIAAFVTICETSARAAAEQADLQLAQGVDRGPLHGIPIVIKDNLATADAPTTANSHVLDPNWGKRADATTVRKLREAGAVILGKTGLYEFALGQPDPALGFPIPKNPWNLSRIPGGSSNGTAAAITAGLALGGLGTDTGGSIRVPAAYCGITGLKPTFGRVSKEGCVPLSYSLDTVGPLAHTVRDCALLLQAIAGYDSGDSYTVKTSVPDMTAGLPGSLVNVRLGLPREYFFTASQLNPEVKAAVLRAVDEMAMAGAKIVDLYLPHLAEAYAAWWTITFAEAYAYHEPDLQRCLELYGPATRLSILTGSLLTAADYLQAQRLRSLLQVECAAALTEVDGVIVPCTIATAPEAEDWDHFTTPSFTSLWSLLGYPALSLNCGFSSDGLPIGMQIVGKPFQEPKLLAIGDAYQQITTWHNQRALVAQENYEQ